MLTLKVILTINQMSNCQSQLFSLRFCYSREVRKLPPKLFLTKVNHHLSVIVVIKPVLSSDTRFDKVLQTFLRDVSSC